MAKLTSSEINIVVNKALTSFGKVTKEEMMHDIYGIRHDSDPARGERLWLYVFALNSWDNTNVANNYITEEQMLKIVSKVQRNGV